MAMKKCSLLARDVAWPDRSVLNFKERVATRFLLLPPINDRRMYTILKMATSYPTSPPPSNISLCPILNSIVQSMTSLSAALKIINALYEYCITLRCMSVASQACHSPAHLIHLYFFILILYGAEYTSCSPRACSFLQFRVTCVV